MITPSTGGARRAVLAAGLGALLVVAGGAGCRRPADDAEVVGSKAAAPRLDAARAGSDRRELGRVLGLSHAQAWELLGPHRVQATTELRLWDGDAPPREPEPEPAGRRRRRRRRAAPEPLSRLLVTENLLAARPGGDFSLVQLTGPETGKELVRKAGVFYSRPRYGIFTRWPVAEEHDDDRWREDAFSGLSVYTRLFWRRLGHRPGASGGAGAATVAGRPVVRVTLSLSEKTFGRAPRAGAEDAAEGRGRAWRRTLEVLELDGELALDRKTAVPLLCMLTASYRFRRGARTLSARLRYRRQLDEIGVVPTIAAPDGAQPPPERQHLVEERDFLLGRIPALSGVMVPPKGAGGGAGTGAGTERKNGKTEARRAP